MGLANGDGGDAWTAWVVALRTSANLGGGVADIGLGCAKGRAEDSTACRSLGDGGV